MIHIGIDPGTGGAIAVINSKGKILGVYDVPIIYRKITGRKSKTVKDYDLKACFELIQGIRYRFRKRKVDIWLEKVQPMPINGGIANFSMGRGKGIWEGLMVGCGIDLLMVPPQTWKRKIFGKSTPKKSKKKLKGQTKKNLDIKMALKLFPKATKYIKLKKHHDRADALLIAEYGRRFNEDQ